jgi:endonuclease/exonuclease/phosphatase family metal-dependent hydrolase
MRLRLKPYDIYALSEVDPVDFEVFRRACGDLYKSLNSATGNDDRLQIIFNGDRFELDGQEEMNRYREFEMNNGNHRSPLMVRLRERSTGRVFQVVANHLARGKDNVRNRQAIGLREWARDQTLPTITIGDFNLDYDFHTMRGNQAFIEIQRDNLWQWVKPREMIDTNWSDPDGDGKDNFPDSMLDFAFVAGPAKSWKAECSVLVEENDFPDGPGKSDHRPIQLIVTP